MSKDSSLTYGQLEAVLQELGYRPTPTADKAGYYWNYPEFDAIKYLPAVPKTKTAPSYELITIRKVSIEKGIIEAEDFETLLDRVLLQPADTPASLDAA
jgi:hypothetical protein